MRRIVILAGQGESTNYLYQILKDTNKIERVIIEEPYSKKKFLKYRIKKLGFFSVIGQLLFIQIITPFLKRQAESRKKEILDHANIVSESIPQDLIHRVSSVNSAEARALLADIQPDYVVVNGTRIIGKKTLSTLPKKFVNTHAGITPYYRGVHGGYWALRENDIKNFGVTVHFVDAGVDTGNIISQVFITPTEKDNFTTYPILQALHGFERLRELLQDDEKLQAIKGVSTERESKQWFHPTLFGYLYYRVFRGVK